MAAVKIAVVGGNALVALTDTTAVTTGFRVSLAHSGGEDAGIVRGERGPHDGNDIGVNTASESGHVAEDEAITANDKDLKRWRLRLGSSHG